MDLEQLRQRLQEINERCHELKNQAAAEKRDFTADEADELDNLLNEADKVEGDIARLERLEKKTEDLKKGSGRKTAPNNPGRDQRSDEDEEDEEDTPRRRRQGLSIADRRERVPAEPIKERKAGFPSFGIFALAVKDACSPGGNFDRRLETLATPTTYGREGSGADGGFAVPTDFRTEIMVKVMGEDSLLPRTDSIPIAGNQFVFPIDETTPWDTSRGILAYWENEGAAKRQSKPALDQGSVRANKITALVPVTDELLEDAPAMDTYLRRKAPEKINFKINLAIIQGTGTGQPKGILASGALVSVPKETVPSAQLADTLLYRNIVKMWSRMWAPSRSRAVWLMNQDAEAELPFMEFDPGSTVPFPVYLPAGGATGTPLATLLGRPIIPTEACNALGDQGDVILADLSQYLTVRKQDNPRVDVSMHLFFDYDMTAYRFVLRIGGQPWWLAPVSPRVGTNTRSPFVTLDDRP